MSWLGLGIQSASVLRSNSENQEGKCPRVEASMGRRMSYIPDVEADESAAAAAAVLTTR